jgi:hypothetical protein
VEIWGETMRVDVAKRVTHGVFGELCGVSVLRGGYSGGRVRGEGIGGRQTTQ